MERKEIDLNHTMHALCTQHSELKELFYRLGFADITKPGMLETAGRFMTPLQGAALKHIPLETMLQTLAESGYYVTH